MTVLDIPAVSGWDAYTDDMLLDLATKGACDCVAEAAALELEARKTARRERGAA